MGGKEQSTSVSESGNPALLHISEVAKRLGLTIRQVKVLCTEKRLASTVIVNKTYVEASSLHGYIEAVRDGAA
jgi:hypothetical protein